MTRTYTRRVTRTVHTGAGVVTIDEDVTLTHRGEGAYGADYDVVFRGQVIGTVSQTTICTDRKAGRLRIPGKGRPGFRSELAHAVKRDALAAMRDSGKDPFFAFRGGEHDTMGRAAAHVVVMHVQAVDWIG